MRKRRKLRNSKRYESLKNPLHLPPAATRLLLSIPAPTTTFGSIHLSIILPTSHSCIYRVNFSCSRPPHPVHSHSLSPCHAFTPRSFNSFHSHSIPTSFPLKPKGASVSILSVYVYMCVCTHASAYSVWASKLKFEPVSLHMIISKLIFSFFEIFVFWGDMPLSSIFTISCIQHLCNDQSLRLVYQIKI